MSSVSQSISEAQRPGAAETQRTVEAKEAFIASLTSAGHSIDAELQTRAKNIHADSQALIQQEKDIQRDTKKLSKENDAAQKFLDKSTKQLAAFDDLGPIQEGLSDDLADIEAMLAALEDENAEMSSDDTRIDPNVSKNGNSKR